MFDNRNEIIFDSILGRRKFLHDPVGWEELDTTVGRSRNTNGIFTTISQNLEFVFDARQYLLDLYLLQGVQADCTMIRRKRDLKTDSWEVVDQGNLDFTKFKWNKTSCTLDFIENGFSERFDNYKSEKFEIDRVDDINGNLLPALFQSSLMLSGTRVFLKSAFYIEQNDLCEFQNLDNGNNYENRVIPLKLDYKSDENIVQPFGTDFEENNQNYGNGSSSNMFYLNADRERSIVLNGTISGRHVGASSTEFFRFDLIKYKLDDNGVYQNLGVTVLKNVQGNNQSISYTFSNYEINLKEGESLALGCSIFSGGRSNVVFDASRIEITEDSAFRATNTQGITAFRLAERLVKIIDFNAEFKSDLLQGDFEGLFFTSGATIRNVKLEDDNGVETKSPLLTTCFKDFFEALNTITPVAYDVYTDNGKNIVRIENIDYFFNPKPFVKVGRVKEENEIDEDWIYKGIKIGYEQSGDIEGVYGLRATHTVNSYTLPIDRVDNIYEVVTDYRTDPNEIEDCRRIQQEDYPERDTKYDKDIFIIDTLLEGNRVIRPNSQDFSSVTGIYAADTTFNNRLSPANCLLRHAKVFKSGMHLDFYQDKKVRYSNTTGQNNNLVTTLIGGEAIPEELNIEISKLDAPIFSAVKTTFTTTLEQGVYQAIKRNGKTDSLPNKFKLVEYIDDSGNRQQGFIYKVEFKNEIKYELRWLQD